jgi:hypothetical protein
MQTTSDSTLRVYCVWVPFEGGAERDVPRATLRLPDARARHFWDGDAYTTKAFREPLDLPVPAWDVYMVYGPEAEWTGETPPEPQAWMHQLRGAKGPPYDPQALARVVQQALALKRAA